VGANEVGAYQFQRWSERPGSMISESLVRALRASGKYRSVMESSSAMAGDYQLRGKLFEFDEVDLETIQTRISLRVDLVDMKTRQVVWGDLVKHEEPVGSKNIKEVVASLNRNLDAVAKETAEGVGKFLAAQH
jgi:cholesterol transport system auxiliary component